MHCTMDFKAESAKARKSPVRGKTGLFRFLLGGTAMGRENPSVSRLLPFRTCEIDILLQGQSGLGARPLRPARATCPFRKFHPGWVRTRPSKMAAGTNKLKWIEFLDVLGDIRCSLEKIPCIFPRNREPTRRDEFAKDCLRRQDFRSFSTLRSPPRPFIKFGQELLRQRACKRIANAIA